MMQLVHPSSLFFTRARYASVGTGPVFVCLSVTSRCSVKRDEQINLVFGRVAFLDQS